jgi:hypothetical protein
MLSNLGAIVHGVIECGGASLINPLRYMPPSQDSLASECASVAPLTLPPPPPPLQPPLCPAALAAHLEGLAEGLSEEEATALLSSLIVSAAGVAALAGEGAFPDFRAAQMDLLAAPGGRAALRAFGRFSAAWGGRRGSGAGKSGARWAGGLAAEMVEERVVWGAAGGCGSSVVFAAGAASSAAAAAGGGGASTSAGTGTSPWEGGWLGRGPDRLEVEAKRARAARAHAAPQPPPPLPQLPPPPPPPLPAAAARPPPSFAPATSTAAATAASRLRAPLLLGARLSDLSAAPFTDRKRGGRIYRRFSLGPAASDALELTGLDSDDGGGGAPASREIATRAIVAGMEGVAGGARAAKRPRPPGW